jgi:hypothetical protein
MAFQLKDIPDIEVLEYQQRWWEDNNLPYVYEELGKKYGSQKLVLKKMEKLVENKYLEYGVSLRTAWLTDKGKSLISK